MNDRVYINIDLHLVMSNLNTALKRKDKSRFLRYVAKMTNLLPWKSYIFIEYSGTITFSVSI